jgi:hypothetical protein
MSPLRDRSGAVPTAGNNLAKHEKEERRETGYTPPLNNDRFGEAPHSLSKLCGSPPEQL